MPKPVYEEGDVTVLWNQAVHTGREVTANRPGIIIKHKKEKKYIRKKTGAQNIVKEIKQYQKKWLHHVQRMDRNRLTRQALKYRPEGRRNIGRQKKRC